MAIDSLESAIDAIDVSLAADQLRAQLSALNLNTRGNKATIKKRLASIKKNGLPREIQPSREQLLKQHESRRRDTPLEYLLVIDFEATCDESTKPITSKSLSMGEIPQKSAEIIEFPIVLVDIKASKIVATFSTHVRPVLRPKLSDFCQTLTGITQEQVDNAEPFDRVLLRVNEWLEKHCTNFKPSIMDRDSAVSVTKERSPDMTNDSEDHSFPNSKRHRIRNWAIVTDGRSDLENFLTDQLAQSKIEYPDWTLGPYIESRALFASFSKGGRLPLLQQLRFLGLIFEGQEHCGLDDAINIARIMLEIKRRGGRLEVNRYMESIDRDWMPGQKKSYKRATHRK